ncbi:hypothetical protein LTS10_007615 [Elasticomyces elasticus]|nr:hypothetical protein LTS10_007615 [Elasticomyces elasticus]
MQGTYTYQRLNAMQQEIRLLDVMPGSGNDPIQVVIRHISVKAADWPLYETISYVLGDSTRSAWVGVGSDSLHLNVPASTEIALKKVRRPDQIRIVWIDAVSINQDVGIEREQQVAMMKEIYAVSSGNLVCPEASIDAAVVDTLMVNTAEETDDLRCVGATVQDQSHGGGAVSTIEPLVDIDLPALQHLLEHPWFRCATLGCVSIKLIVCGRLWIVQEAALAPKNTVLLHTVQLDLLEIIWAIVWWNHRKTNSAVDKEGLSVLREGTIKGPHCCGELWDLIDHEHGWWAGHLSLLGLLNGSLSPALTPDYTKPLRDVLKTATRHMIALAGDLRILRSIKHHTGDLELAEVATWAARADKVCTRDDEAEFPNLFKSSKGLEKVDTTNLYDTDSDILCMNGITVDKIASVTTIFTYSEHHRFNEFTHWMRSGLQLCLDTRGHQVPAQAVRALATALAIDCSSNGFRAAEATARVVMQQAWAFSRTRGRAMPECESQL